MTRTFYGTTRRASHFRQLPCGSYRYLFGLTLGFDPGTEMSWEQLFDAMYFYAYVSFVIGLVLYAVYEWQRSVRS